MFQKIASVVAASLLVACASLKVGKPKKPTASDSPATPDITEHTSGDAPVNLEQDQKFTYWRPDVALLNDATVFIAAVAEDGTAGHSFVKGYRVSDKVFRQSSSWQDGYIDRQTGGPTLAKVGKTLVVSWVESAADEETLWFSFLQDKADQIFSDHKVRVVASSVRRIRHPQLASNGSSTFVLAWLEAEQEKVNFKAAFLAFSGQEVVKTEIVTIAHDALMTLPPVVAFDGSGNLQVVWVDGASQGGVFYSRINQEAVVLVPPPQRLRAFAGAAAGERLLSLKGDFAATGSGMVVWLEEKEELNQLWAQGFEQGTPAEPYLVAEAKTLADPAVLYNAGKSQVAWTALDAAASKSQIYRRELSGEKLGDTATFSTPGTAFYPAILQNEKGLRACLWLEKGLNTNWEIWGSFVQAGGDWREPQKIAASKSSDLTQIKAVLTAPGRLVVTWAEANSLWFKQSQLE